MGTDGALMILWVVVALDSIGLILVLRFLSRHADAFHHGESDHDAVPILRSGNRAPSFAFETSAGRTVARPDVNDGPVVLAFLSNSCRSCEAIIPHIRRYIDSADYDTTILPIVLDAASMDEARSFVLEHSLHDGVAIGEDRGVTTARRFSLTATPSFVRVEPGGAVSFSGMIGDDSWDDMVTESSVEKATR